LLSSAAQAGTPYIGVEGGLGWARDNDIDEVVDYQSDQPGIPPISADQEYDDVFRINYGKKGYDVGIVGGYDFGWLRLEGEVRHMKTALTHIDADDGADAFLTSFNSTLNRPAFFPDPGYPGMRRLTTDDFDIDGNIRVSSAMANALLDIKVGKGVYAYLGYGAGRSQVRAMGDKDSAWSWQRIFGLRYKLNDRIELGTKFRMFNSGMVKLKHKPVAYSGNPDRVVQGGTTVDRTTNAVVVPEIEGAYRPRSLLATFTYNF
jgi:opacity protein-like surface antigen